VNPSRWRSGRRPGKVGLRWDGIVVGGAARFDCRQLVREARSTAGRLWRVVRRKSARRPQTVSNCQRSNGMFVQVSALDQHWSTVANCAGHVPLQRLGVRRIGCLQTIYLRQRAQHGSPLHTWAPFGPRCRNLRLERRIEGWRPSWLGGGLSDLIGAG
jgi:hypothetical protein